jgi:hypothetical protein
MSATHSANKIAARKPPGGHASRKRKRNQRSAPFIYPEPFFPRFQTLLNEAFRGEDDAVTEEHVFALVGELLATRETLQLLCPNYEVPSSVRKWIERICGAKTRSRKPTERRKKAA